MLVAAPRDLQRDAPAYVGRVVAALRRLTGGATLVPPGKLARLEPYARLREAVLVVLARPDRSLGRGSAYELGAFRRDRLGLRRPARPGPRRRAPAALPGAPARRAHGPAGRLPRGAGGVSRSTTLAAELAALAREARQLLEPADYLAALEWLDEEARRP